MAGNRDKNRKKAANDHFERAKICQKRQHWPIVGFVYRLRIGGYLAKSVGVDDPIPDRRFAWAEFLYGRGDTSGAIVALNQAISDAKRIQLAAENSTSVSAEMALAFRKYSWVLYEKMGEWSFEMGEFEEAEASLNRVVREVGQVKGKLSWEVIPIYQYCVLEYSQLLLNTQRFDELSKLLHKVVSDKGSQLTADFLSRVEKLDAACKTLAGILPQEKSATDLRMFLAERYRDLKKAITIDELRDLRVRIIYQYYTLRISQVINTAVDEAIDLRTKKSAKESAKLRDIKKRLKELSKKQEKDPEDSHQVERVDDVLIRETDRQINEAIMQALHNIEDLDGLSKDFDSAMIDLTKSQSDLRLPLKLRLRFAWIWIKQYSLKILIGVFALGALSTWVVSQFEIEALVYVGLISVLGWFVTGKYVDPLIDRAQVKNYKNALIDLLTFVGTDARLRLISIKRQLHNKGGDKTSGDL